MRAGGVWSCQEAFVLNSHQAWDCMLFVSFSFALGTQCERGFWLNIGFKPIFHCNAKLLALGNFASPDARIHVGIFCAR